MEIPATPHYHDGEAAARTVFERCASGVPVKYRKGLGNVRTLHEPQRVYHGGGRGLGAGMWGLSSILAADGPIDEAWDPDKPPRVTGRPLRVQPILAHGVAVPRENLLAILEGDQQRACGRGGNAPHWRRA